MRALTIFVGVGLATAASAAMLEATPAGQAKGRTPLPEVHESIEYPSVAAALKALKARPGVVMSTDNGWTIATDEAAYAIWSFAPPGYPAYPAVVKRQVVPRGSGSQLQMKVRCEASKEACDDLVRTFARMNGFNLQE